MVCAAVSLRISPDFIEKIYQVRLIPCITQILDFNTVVNLIDAATQCLQGTVIAERGDLYNLDAWRVCSILGRDFKYPESVGERNAIELAHHISFAGWGLATRARDDKAEIDDRVEDNEAGE